MVKAFTHEEQAKADFRALNTAYRDAAQKANFYSIMIMPVSGNLMNISYAPSPRPLADCCLSSRALTWAVWSFT